MKIAIVGTGSIGISILNYLNNLGLKADTYDIHNLSDIKNKNYEILFLSTPMKAVEEVRINIINEPLVITTIKGIKKNKIVSDYFENVVSLNGYYTPSLFEPKICYENDKKLIGILFPNFKKYKVNVKEALIANYLKNMYLVIMEKVGEKRVIQDVDNLRLNRIVKKLLVEDIVKSKKFKSRNYLFSRLVYINKNSPSKIIDRLGLIEGVESFLSSDKFYSDFLTNI